MFVRPLAASTMSFLFFTACNGGFVASGSQQSLATSGGGASAPGAPTPVVAGPGNEPTSVSGSSGGTGGSVSQPNTTTSPTTVVPIPSSIDNLMQYSNGSTKASSTPMGSHYAGMPNATSAQLSFLSDPSKEPAVPDSTSGLHMQAFTVTLYPNGDPSPADINQHAIGDCDGDSILATLAYQHPAFLKSIIQDNKNGTFTITMYDPNGNVIHVGVDSMFLADGGNNVAAVSGKSGAADWATVLEKAAMKYITVWPVVSDIGGIGSEMMSPMFTGTGDSFAFGDGALNANELTQAVVYSLQHGALITGGFSQVDSVGQDQTVTGHGYAVFFPSDANMMVAMRNPWGVSPTPNGYDGNEDGVLNIPTALDWSNIVDLRIIQPGAAGSTGNTTPYAEPRNSKAVRTLVRISEPHAH